MVSLQRLLSNSILFSMTNLQDTTKDGQSNATPALAEHINHNGLINSPPLTQVIPPILIIAIFIMTLTTVNSYFQNKGALVAMDLILVIGLGVVMWLWYLATSLIPTDSVQLRHLAAIEKGQQFDHSNLAFFCHICKTYINRNCYHCKRCRRCVQFMDHHCKWLNNCIGAKNYFQFYGLIISTFLLLAISISISCFCLSKIDVDSQTDKLVLLCAILTILAGAVPCVWLMYLICLHTYLILTKKTTIQLIMESRAKHRITPQNDKNHPIFKVSFAKNNQKQVTKKVDLPAEKQQEFDSSNSQTNNQLVRPREEIIDMLQVSTRHKDRTLPPLKTKLSFSLFQDKKNKEISFSLTPIPRRS